jgi:hypothetical protein
MSHLPDAGLDTTVDDSGEFISLATLMSGRGVVTRVIPVKPPNPLALPHHSLVTLIAQATYSYEDIGKQFALTEGHVAWFAMQPGNKAQIERVRAEFNHPDNLRAKLQSLAQTGLAEFGLPEGFRLLLDPETPAAAKVGLIKEMRQIAGIGEGDGPAGAGGPQFAVIINMGDRVETIDMVPNTAAHELAA